MAGVGLIPALTEARIFASLLQWGIDRFAQANAVGVAETGAEGGARSVTDEVLPCVYCQKNLFRYVRTQTRTKSERPCLGDADTHAPRMCQFPTGEG